jgi:hypothetical protein
MEILTLREWKNEFVRVLFNDGVKVISFGDVIINTIDVDTVEDLKFEQRTLNRYYKFNFKSIQKKYKMILS